MKTIMYEAVCGEHIKNTIDMSIKIACEKQCNVQFNFNGVDIVVNPNSICEDVMQEWETCLNLNAEKYRNSPEGIKQKQEWKEKIKKAQNKMDVLQFYAASVWKCNKNWNRKMKWIVDFQDASYFGINKNTELLVKIISQFHTLGWGVGKPEEFFNKKENMARYVIGQWLDFMKNSGCGNDMVGYYAEKTLKK